MKKRKPRSLSDTVLRVGSPKAPWSDLYHFLLRAPWWQVLLGIAGVYVSLNVFFALLYQVVGGRLDGATTFVDRFFFSIQTFSTIGYGSIVPRGLASNVLVTVEAFVGMMFIAVVTGIVFSKFSRPTARVAFSKHALVSTRDGIPTFMFRMANERGTMIAEASARVAMTRWATTLEGERIRKIVDLPLSRAHTGVFTLTWLVMSPIREDNPLYGMSPEELVSEGVDFVVSVTGLDETFGQTVHSRHIYHGHEVLFGPSFQDVLSRLPDGRTQFDYTQFHEVVHKG